MAGFERGVRPIGLWSMSMTLSISARPSIRACAPDRHVAPVEGPRDRGVEDVVHEGALARPGDAGDAHEEAQGERRVDVLRLFSRAPAHGDPPAVALPPLGRDLDGQLAPQVAAGQARLRLRDLGRRARGDDLAAVASRPRAEVDQPVRLLHRLVVVLDHHHRVADVAQVLEGGEELLVVALVEADRWLVEDVDDAGQLGADLAGEADPLALAAGEAGSGAVEGQVGEAHVEEEAQARADLLEELGRDLRLRALELEGVEEGVGLRDGEGRDLGDRPSRDLHAEGLGADPPAVAGRAGPGGEVLLVVLPHLLRLRLPHAPHHRVDGALVAHLEGAAAPGARDLDAHPLAARAEEDHPAVLLGERLPRLVEVDPALAGDRPHDVAAPGGGLADGAERLDRALVHRELRVRHHEGGVHLHAGAEAGALGAHALGRVEREELRRRLREGDPAVVAGAVLGEDLVGLALGGDDDGALPELERRLHRVGEALAEPRLRDQAVHDRVDRVLLLLVEADLVVERQHDAVHPHPGEAGLPDLLDHVTVLALPLLHERGEDEELRPLRELAGPRGRSAAPTAARRAARSGGR